MTKLEKLLAENDDRSDTRRTRRISEMPDRNKIRFSRRLSDVEVVQYITEEYNDIYMRIGNLQGRIEQAMKFSGVDKSEFQEVIRALENADRAMFNKMPDSWLDHWRG